MLFPFYVFQCSDMMHVYVPSILSTVFAAVCVEASDKLIPSQRISCCTPWLVNASGYLGFYMVGQSEELVELGATVSFNPEAISFTVGQSHSAGSSARGGLVLMCQCCEITQLCQPY